MKSFSKNFSSAVIVPLGSMVLLSACRVSDETELPLASACGAELEQVVVATVNARDYDQFRYFDLDSGQELALSAADAARSEQWDVAFRRNNIILNSGPSGPGQVSAAMVSEDMVNTRHDVYDEEGRPNWDVLPNIDCDSELPALLDDYPHSGLHFAQDARQPAIRVNNLDVAPGFIDHGWYLEDITSREFSPNSDWIFLMRSGEGDSYAKLRATALSFDQTSGLSTTLELDVQKAGDRGFNDRAQFVLTNAGLGNYCFDFDSNANVACDDGVQWDLKLEFGEQGWVLLTNAGVSGKGRGGVFGALTATSSLLFEEGTRDILGQRIDGHYFADKNTSILDESWYAYHDSEHKLYANYRVFILDTGTSEHSVTSPRYQFQILDYYSDNAVSGELTFRYRRLE
jgi:hypothetical protein